MSTLQQDETAPPQLAHRRLPIGAEVGPEGVHFRVWAPQRQRVEVALEEGGLHELSREEDGYFSGLVAEARAGSRYRYRLDGGDAFPDPASRFQPEGPHGPSQVVDPDAFRWTDHAWPGVALCGTVLYEIHIGTFTQEGTWAAAMEQLPTLAELGVTVLEVMPVAEVPGRFNWGYDGVNLFAPTRMYGGPDDLRRFVDRAHALGLGVILDVVYNHLGPDGNYLAQYSPRYFTDRHCTDWGEAINFDGEGAGPVREFYIANAGYWIDEYHFDGLRLDATQDIHDDSEPHILAEVSRAVRAKGRGKGMLLVGENEPQDVRLITPLDQGGYGLDTLWNDDFHHSAMVRLTGRTQAYYTDYRGAAQEFVSAIKYGYLYQGQRYRWQKKRRGTSGLGFNPPHFCLFIQNHDQVANSSRGSRVHQLTAPGRFRALTALTLLAPGTPMLFMGQEFAASAPFLYFADHQQALADLVRKGRRKFMAQFRSMALPEMTEVFDPPHDIRTFERSKLDHGEREANAGTWRMHQDLLRLRREDPVLRRQRHRGVDGAVLNNDCFVLRFFAEGPDEGLDRLLVVNFGIDLHYDPAPEPLMAPPRGMEWDVLWSSENPAYGGDGTAPLDTVDNWLIPGHAAVLLTPGEWRGEAMGEFTGAAAEKRSEGVRLQ